MEGIAYSLKKAIQIILLLLDTNVFAESDCEEQMIPHGLEDFEK